MKIYQSIDGSDSFFKSLKILNAGSIDSENKIITPIGEASAISNLPFFKNSTLIKRKKKFIELDKKKKILNVSANYIVGEIHNFLLEKNFYFPAFPSYPGSTIGGCIACGSHGFNPSFGIINDYITEIVIYNSNFGYKKLTKNSKLFYYSLSTFGITGEIISAKLKVKKITRSHIVVKKIKFDNLFKCYQYMKKNKNYYNQNSFFIESITDTKVNFRGMLRTGKKITSIKKVKKIKIKTIPSIRLGLLKYSLFKKIIFFSSFFLDKLKANIIDLNKVVFHSNDNLIYFALMPKKFVEHQNIISSNKVKKYLKELETLIIKYKPNISLVHLKIFKNKKKSFEFDGNGLSIAMHIIHDNNFNHFYKNFLKMELKYKCILNFYKNSYLDFNIFKKMHAKELNSFRHFINKINKKYKYTNNLFKTKLYEKFKS